MSYGARCHVRASDSETTRRKDLDCECMDSADKEAKAFKKEAGRVEGANNEPCCQNLVLVHRAFRLFWGGAYLRFHRKVVAGNLIIRVGLDFRRCYLDEAVVIFAF